MMPQEIKKRAEDLAYIEMPEHKEEFVQIGDMLDLINDMYIEPMNQILFLGSNNGFYEEMHSKLGLGEVLSYDYLLDSLKCHVPLPCRNELVRRELGKKPLDWVNLWGMPKRYEYDERHAITRPIEYLQGIHHVSIKNRLSDGPDVIYIGFEGSLMQAPSRAKFGLCDNRFYKTDTDPLENVLSRFIDLTKNSIIPSDDYITFSVVWNILYRLQKFI